jgi:GMP reductase
MRIEYDIKLDFKDVLIRPKRSVLKSRSDVSLEREFKFKHTKSSWTGVPIIAANMDHTGTIAMATALSQHHLLTAMDKFITLQEWQSFASAHPDSLPFSFVSIGLSDKDFSDLDEVLQAVPVKFICLDVANGYTERFVSYLEDLRAKHPQAVIMAGNVVTGEMAEELILSGADIV